MYMCKIKLTIFLFILTEWTLQAELNINKENHKNVKVEELLTRIIFNMKTRFELNCPVKFMGRVKFLKCTKGITNTSNSLEEEEIFSWENMNKIYVPLQLSKRKYFEELSLIESFTYSETEPRRREKINEPNILTRNPHKFLSNCNFLIFILVPEIEDKEELNLHRINGFHPDDFHIFLSFTHSSSDNDDNQKRKLQKVMKMELINRIRHKIGISIQRGIFSIFFESTTTNKIIELQIKNLGSNSDLPDFFGNVKKVTQVLKNRHIKTGAFSFSTYRHVTNVKRGGRKFQHNLVMSYPSAETASRMLNITFTNVKRPFHASKYPNGSWSGMMSELISGKFDVFINMGITHLHFQYIDCGPFGLEYELTFITSLPHAEIPWTAFLRPFQLALWTLILFTFLILLGLSYGYFRYQHKILKSAGNSQPDLNRALFILIGPLLSQSICRPSLLPRSSRPLFIPWIFGCFVIINYYSNNLLSELTLPTPDPIPSDFNQLIFDPRFQDFNIHIRHFPGGVGINIINSSKSPLHVKLRNRFHLNNDTTDCLLQAASERKTVCITWKNVVKAVVAKNFTLRRNFEPLFYTRKPLLSTHGMIATPRNSKYGRAFHWIFGGLRDTGHTSRFSQNVLDYNEKDGIEWLKSVGKRMKSDDDSGSGSGARGKTFDLYRKLNDLVEKSMESTVKPFKIGQLKAPFGALIFGCLFAFLAFVWESFYSCIICAFVQVKQSKK